VPTQVRTDQDRVERRRVFAEAQPGPLPELELGPARDRFERAADLWGSEIRFRVFVGSCAAT
jgi:hypothetical protein